MAAQSKSSFMLELCPRQILAKANYLILLCKALYIFLNSSLELVTSSQIVWESNTSNEFLMFELYIVICITTNAQISIYVNCSLTIGLNIVFASTLCRFRLVIFQISSKLKDTQIFISRDMD